MITFNLQKCDIGQNEVVSPAGGLFHITAF